MKRAYITLYLLGCVTLLMILHSCATMGTPSGGPIDVLPPILVRSVPEQGATNFHGDRIELIFDENVTLKDQSDKVLVSPAQKQVPTVRSNGKHVTVEFNDTLLPNTTYTIDFNNCIQDNNESNPLEDFAFSFSTGESIDSLQIAGIVLGASNLEPQQNIIVGVHCKDLTDLAFYKTPFDRIARTNSLGQFRLRNLKEGQYRIFAINDVDRDNKHANPAEDIAFYDGIITPTAKRVEHFDTIRKVTHEIDSILQCTHTEFLPNDVFLSMFNENRKSRYLSKYERVDSTKLTFQFGAPNDSLPVITPLNFTPQKKHWYRLNYNESMDTLTYWLTDPSLIAQDSLKLVARYIHTGKDQQLEQYNDTLLFKRTRVKIKPKKKEKGDTVTVIPQIFTDFSAKVAQQQELTSPMRFSALTPLEGIDHRSFRLQIKKDTLWTDCEPLILKQDTLRNLERYHIDYHWEPGAEYKLNVDSAAVIDIYGHVNKASETKFKVKAVEEYCDLYIDVNFREPAFVELLGTDDTPKYTATLKDGVAQFLSITPGAYYARLIHDRNGNGKWDTGNYDEHLQPEDVYYYSKKLNLRKNWEVTEHWDLFSLPVDKQKPSELKKNKPEAKKWEQKKTETKKSSDDDDTTTASTKK